MLKELNIENVAVIEKAAVEFSSGLNVLTGETGAGKSILIDSINAILGNRTTREIVRTGTDKSTIWATFTDVSKRIADDITAQGYDCDGTLILHRQITADGKSACRINGKPATAANVRAVCSTLINIHGQHDNQDLLNPDRHIYIIDNFAELAGILGEYSSVYSRMTKLKNAIEKMSMDEAEKERQLDLLKYQIEEIEKAELTVGEDADLAARRNMIRNSERILESIKGAYGVLAGDSENDGALSMIFSASGMLEKITGINDEIDGASDKLSESYYSLSDITSELRDLLDGFDYNPGDLEAVEERLDLIYKLKRKYGEEIEDVILYLEDSREQLENIEMSGELLEKYKAEYEIAFADAMKLAGQLSELRYSAFARFEERIKDELSYLNMPNVAFVTNCEKGKLTRLGFDIVEFYISTNVGEPPKPMSKIASGGELSRIMLAIKNALADKDDIDTLIFDEIDTGVSGASAARIGNKLKQSAASRQTICVTHSPQIAAYAGTHIKISKSVRGERTYTDIERLDDSGRKQELARIISGDNVTETALKNAAEMLELAT